MEIAAAILAIIFDHMKVKECKSFIVEERGKGHCEIDDKVIGYGKKIVIFGSTPKDFIYIYYRHCGSES